MTTQHLEWWEENALVLLKQHCALVEQTDSFGGFSQKTSTWIIAWGGLNALLLTPLWKKSVDLLTTETKPSFLAVSVCNNGLLWSKCLGAVTGDEQLYTVFDSFVFIQ
jgi:hypothetical protein